MGHLSPLIHPNKYIKRNLYQVWLQLTQPTYESTVPEAVKINLLRCCRNDGTFLVINTHFTEGNKTHLMLLVKQPAGESSLYSAFCCSALWCFWWFKILLNPAVNLTEPFVLLLFHWCDTWPNNLYRWISVTSLCDTPQGTEWASESRHSETCHDS